MLPLRRLLFAWLPAALFLPVFSPPAIGQAPGNYAAIIASMREDIRLLDERTRSLRAEIEQLKRENQELRERVASTSTVTREQFNMAVAELEKAIIAGDKDVALQLTKQMERLAAQTQSALDAMARSGGGGGRVTGPVPTVPDVDYPKSGITYTVQPGDNLLGIAQKYNSQVPWIQAANKIADPRTLQVGQTLFIPQK